MTTSKHCFLRSCAVLLCAALCIFLLSACSGGLPRLDPKRPTRITVWHYYNGAQKDAFAEIVREFNLTEGKDRGIVVEEFSQGGVNDLADTVLEAAKNSAQGAEMPNIFAAYADNAFAADELGVVADVAPYFTQEEQKAYIGGYLDEGRFHGDSLKIFPVAKSTEVFMLNDTDWQPFAEATGLTEEKAFATVESLTETAGLYYAWTDAQTPDTPGDGKALFGRDAFANYMIIGARQLGTELCTVTDGKATLNFDKATVRKLWDNYYIPTVNGWFAAENRFRSDDVKMGLILSFVGSSSGASFFPKEVVLSDTESYRITTRVLPAPQFAGGEAYAVQQGAGMVVTNASPEEIYASTLFLKWFTSPERNFLFSMRSGYLPVTKEASTPDFAAAAMDAAGLDMQMRDILEVSMSTVQSSTMYTTQAFAAGNDMRKVLESAMPDAAAADRAAIQAAISDGTPAQEALAPYLTDERFDTWYNETLTSLNTLLNTSAEK